MTEDELTEAWSEMVSAEWEIEQAVETCRDQIVLAKALEVGNVSVPVERLELFLKVVAECRCWNAPKVKK